MKVHAGGGAAGDHDNPAAAVMRQLVADRGFSL